MFERQMVALDLIADLGEPGAAVEILNRHMEDVKRHVVARNQIVMYYICGLEWLLKAAWWDEGKRGAHVAEVKALVDQVTRSVRGLRSEDWDEPVSAWASPWGPDWVRASLT
jgi:hypothetical protein